MNNGKLIINSIRVLNHKWIITNFSDGDLWGELLLKYEITEDKALKFDLVNDLQALDVMKTELAKASPDWKEFFTALTGGKTYARVTGKNSGNVIDVIETLSKAKGVKKFLEENNLYTLLPY